MESVINSVQESCCCCGMFVSARTSNTYNKNHPLMSSSAASGLLVMSDLDCCAINGNSFRFCINCSKSLRRNKRPKYGRNNALPNISCQAFPSALEGLSMAEEAAIARAHPVVSILKLSPNGAFNLAVTEFLRVESCNTAMTWS